MRAVRLGEIRPDLDLEVGIDILRLLTGSGPLTPAFVDGIFERFLRGARPAA